MLGLAVVLVVLTVTYVGGKTLDPFFPDRQICDLTSGTWREWTFSTIAIDVVAGADTPELPRPIHRGTCDRG